MGKMKDIYMAIMECPICEGEGISDKWVSPDGDYDFQWCECNPFHLVVKE